MNTTEIKTKGLIKSFDDLFLYAKKQFRNYEKIEGISDWDEYDFSIDCAQDQAKFKDMLQIRCVEELTEATHALDNEDHFHEELTDAINFFLSAYCMLGEDLKSFPSLEGKFPKEELGLKYDWSDPRLQAELYIAFYSIVNAIGNLCNLLKNRPWAQSNYLVSMHDFDLRLGELWDVFWTVVSSLGITEEKLFDLFERKYLCNLWRIKTGY